MDLISLGNHREQWITESLGLTYRIALGMKVCDISERIAETKLF